MQIFNLRISNPETSFSAMNFHAKKFLYSSVMSIKGLVFLFLKFRFCQNAETSLRSVDHIGRISINSDNFQQESWKVALSLCKWVSSTFAFQNSSSKFNFCSNSYATRSRSRRRSRFTSSPYTLPSVKKENKKVWEKTEMLATRKSSQTLSKQKMKKCLKLLNTVQRFMLLFFKVDKLDVQSSS